MGRAATVIARVSAFLAECLAAGRVVSVKEVASAVGTADYQQACYAVCKLRLQRRPEAAACPSRRAKPSDNNPTARQAEILAFIAERCEAGIPPTMRDIGRRFGIRSPNGVMHHLQTLEKKKLIRRGEGLARHIEVVGLTPRIERLARLLAQAQPYVQVTAGLGPDVDPPPDHEAEELWKRIEAELNVTRS
jgi:DNA-binding MarR family transcriptional regulator